MRHVTEARLTLIKRFEGFSPIIYVCPTGHPTISHGHLEQSQEPFSAGTRSDQATGPWLRMRGFPNKHSGGSSQQP